MEDADRSREELLEELHALRRQLAGLRQAEADRKESDDLLMAAEERGRLLLQNSAEHITFLDPEMRVVWANRMRSRSQLEMDDVVGRHCYELWYGSAIPCIGCPVVPALETGQPSEGEVTVPDGSVLLMKANPVKDMTGSVVGVLAISLEITAQKQVEEALWESEERFRAVFENAAVGIAVISPDGWLLDYNSATANMLGYRVDELRNSHIADITHPEDLDRHLTMLRALTTRKSGPFQMEKRCVRKGGGIVWVRLTSLLVRTPEGTAAFVVSMIEDITQEKKAQEALRESERKYRDLADSLPETVFEMDMTGRLTFVNQAGFEKFGCSHQDLEKGLNVIDHLVPGDRERAGREIAEAIAGRGVGRKEYGAIGSDGAVFPAVIYSKVVTRDGVPVGLRGFLVDVSEQRQAEKALRESNARFRAIFERAANGVGLTDEEGYFVESNPALQTMLGYTAEELSQLRSAEVTHPEDLPVTVELYQQLMRGRRDHYQLEKRFIRKDGRVIWTRVTVSGFPGDEGGSRYAIGIVEDTSKRKELENQLLRAQRLETAGRLASQVAHDFNNLLGPVTAYPDLIRMELPPDHPALRYCDAMLEAAERMAQINENLMAFGRRGLLDEQVINLNRLVEQAVRQMGPAPDELVVKLSLDPELMPVCGSPPQLSRVIANLLTNAREAMRDVGILSVSTRNVYLDEPVTGFLRVEMGEYVRLEVSDTGCGIPPEIREKVFEAFFTTKRSAWSRGSGLGLSIVQSIVEDHQGGIELRSEVGRGSSFTIFLPVSRESKIPVSAGELKGGSELVLVVDDDMMQQEVARQLLERLGYAVEVAGSGEAALELLRDHPVDLLILDMVMPPGIDGAETFRRALELRAGQRAIIVSGFAESEPVRQAQSFGAGSYLRKPVRLEELARSVREALDQPA